MAVVNDISPEMVRLSRIIDRLPAGSYVVELEKPTDRSPWPFVIREARNVRRGNLARREKKESS